MGMPHKVLRLVRLLTQNYQKVLINYRARSTSSLAAASVQKRKKFCNLPQGRKLSRPESFRSEIRLGEQETSALSHLRIGVTSVWRWILFNRLLRGPPMKHNVKNKKNGSSFFILRGFCCTFSLFSFLRNLESILCTNHKMNLYRWLGFRELRWERHQWPQILSQLWQRGFKSS